VTTDETFEYGREEAVELLRDSDGFALWVWHQTPEGVKGRVRVAWAGHLDLDGVKATEAELVKQMRARLDEAGWDA
jgi:hypothetical protein